MLPLWFLSWVAHFSDLQPRCAFRSPIIKRGPSVFSWDIYGILHTRHVYTKCGKPTLDSGSMTHTPQILSLSIKVIAEQLMDFLHKMVTLP